MVDIFFCGFMDFADWFLVGRVDGLKSLSILTFDELVVDETTITRFSVRSRRFGGGADVSKDFKVRGTCDDSAGVAPGGML